MATTCKIEAVQQSPRAFKGNARANILVDMTLPDARDHASSHAKQYLLLGYWVEVFNWRTGESLAGPLDPSQPLPSYIV